MYINERKKRGKKGLISLTSDTSLSRGGPKDSLAQGGRGGEREGKEVRILSIIYISTPHGWGGVVEKGEGGVICGRERKEEIR